MNETRERRQCTYAVGQQPQAAGVPLAAVPAKQFIVTTAVPTADHLSVVTKHQPLDDLAAIVPALHSIFEGSPRDAAHLLAELPLDTVVGGALAAVSVQMRVVARSVSTLETASQALLGSAPRSKKSAKKAVSSSAFSPPLQASDALLRLSQTNAAELRLVGLYDQGVRAQGASIDDYIRNSANRITADMTRRQQQIASAARIAHAWPVGYLHLEKLRFTPDELHVGQLDYSLTMLPGETVRLVHREWTRTETGFASLVDLTAETAREDRLAETAELTTSFGVQSQHATAFNASVSASGGFGPVTLSASVGANFNDSENKSREDTAKKTRELTSTASSRVKQEHKNTFQVSNETTTEDTSFRELTNTSDAAERWDFRRILQRWLVELYRYDVRLTYDVVVPEPASYLLRAYARLAEIDASLAASPQPLSVGPAGIARGNYLSLSAQYGVALDPPPAAEITLTFQAEKVYASRSAGYDFIDISVPPDYRITTATGEGSNITQNAGIVAYTDPETAQNRGDLALGGSGASSFQWRYFYNWMPTADSAQAGDTLSVTVTVVAVPRDEAFADWQLQSYQRLLDAHTSQLDATRARLADEASAIQSHLPSSDPLLLRKLEQEELVKGVLRWLLGPSFHFYEGPTLGVPSPDDLTIYTSTGSVSARAYGDEVLHLDLVRFVHEAIEWENLLYVCYPYFWTDPLRWGFKQQLQHDDPVHAAFLRSGACRVVIPIRRGYESAFLAFTETLDLNTPLTEDHPYTQIASDIEHDAEQRYPYMPNADDADLDPANRVDSWHEFTPTGAYDVIAGAEDPVRRD
jgi:hypothetical protein